MITFLFTSAGRRVELLQGFRSSMHKLDQDCRILAADLKPEWSAACQVADEAWPVKQISDPDYIDDLVSLCEREGVEVLVPTLDPELEVLAGAQKHFEAVGTRVAVSPAETCAVVGSKRKTAAWLKSAGFRTPAVLTDPLHHPGPVFAKRESSSASIGACRVQGPDHIRLLQADPADYVFQPWIEGQEFTVDAFVTEKGRLHDAVIRKRVEVRAGEISKGETVVNDDIVALVSTLVEGGGRASENGLQSVPSSATEGLTRKTTDLSFSGPVTVQVIREKATGDLWVIEVNPRVGGGLPLSIRAGFDLPRYLTEETTGQPLSPPPPHPGGLRMLRYDAAVFVE